MQDHTGFERKSNGVEIVGIVRCDVLHRGRIGFVALLPSVFAMRASFGQSLNIFHFIRPRRGSELESLLNGLISFRRRDVHVLVHIHVAAVGQCHSPEGHSGLRVELRSSAEGAHSFGTIESENELQTLVELFLRFGVFGGDGMVGVPETGGE
jgi:hypothetical protein